jgi:hypothetical protein
VPPVLLLTEGCHAVDAGNNFPRIARS